MDFLKNDDLSIKMAICNWGGAVLIIATLVFVFAILPNMKQKRTKEHLSKLESNIGKREKGFGRLSSEFKGCYKK